MSKLRDAALQLCGALDQLGIPFVIGGSYASSVHGIGRQTQDLDLIAAILPQHAAKLAASLRDSFYVDEVAIQDAIRQGRPFNVIHFATAFKIDIFPASAHLLGAQQIERRQMSEAAILGPPPACLPVISAEDAILVKLRWYRDGGEISGRQWNDVRNIVSVQKARLDRGYLAEWAARLGVSDLLERLLSEHDHPR